MVRAFDILRELVTKVFINDDSQAIDYAETIPYFLSGEYAMSPMGAWLGPVTLEAGVPFEVRLFDIPVVKGGKGENENAGVFLPTGYLGYSGTNYPNEVAEFLKVLSSEKVGMRIIEKGDVPTNLDALGRIDEVEVTESFKEIIDFTRNIGISFEAPDTGFPLEIVFLFFDAGQKILENVETVDEILTELQEKTEAIRKSQ